MKNSKSIITAVSITFLLTACGQKSSLESLNTSQPVVVSTSSPVSIPTPVPETTLPTPIATDTLDTSKEVISKSYHMNKIYDIVPNDPAGNKNVVLLTFDDGPKEKEMLESIISTLEKHNAKAIFFMNGYRIKQHPELLTFIHEREQILGNHSWDHIDLKKENAEQVTKQIGDVQTIIKEVTGETPEFFRPPFGSGSDLVKEIAKKEGMLFMTWSNGSLDWEMTNKKNDPNKVIENVMKQLRAGSNILMHELPWTATALDKLLTQLEEKGYSFVDPRSIELEMR